MGSNNNRQGGALAEPGMPAARTCGVAGLGPILVAVDYAVHPSPGSEHVVPPRSPSVLHERSDCAEIRAARGPRLASRAAGRPPARGGQASIRRAGSDSPGYLCWGHKAWAGLHCSQSSVLHMRGWRQEPQAGRGRQVRAAAQAAFSAARQRARDGSSRPVCHDTSTLLCVHCVMWMPSGSKPRTVLACGARWRRCASAAAGLAAPYRCDRQRQVNCNVQPPSFAPAGTHKRWLVERQVGTARHRVGIKSYRRLRILVHNLDRL